MNFIHLIILSGIIVGFSMLMLGIRILLKKNSAFPASSIGHNPEMKKRGITCVKHEEMKKFRKCSLDCPCS